MSETHPPVSFPGFVDAGGSGHVLQGFLRLLLRRLQGLQHKTDAATDCRLVEHSVSMLQVMLMVQQAATVGNVVQ